MRHLIVTLFMFFLMTPAAVAAGGLGIVWSCADRAGGDPYIKLHEPLTKNLHLKGTYAIVEIYSIKKDAAFEIDGIEKRWNWSLNKEKKTYGFSILLAAEKTARFYDFTLAKKGGTTKASEILYCDKQKQESK